MSSRLDVSPLERLRLLASSLRLKETDAEEAFTLHRGDVVKAENALRLLTRRQPKTLSVDERLNKCAVALARHPEALDILHASLTKVRDNPSNERMRKVNLSSGIFKDKVASRCAAGVELLVNYGYEPMHGHVVLQRHDVAALNAALCALDRARGLSTYIEAKAALANAQALEAAATRSAADAAACRAAYLAKVPAEPRPGDERDSSACVITVTVAGAPSGAAAAATRRFDSDHTLADLFHFVRSMPSVPIDGAVMLENVTTRPPRALDPTVHGATSLYAADLWPRGQVLVKLVRA